jgi:C1A family cysteine protease
MSGFIPRGFGWDRDQPDFRDYTPEHEAVVNMLEGLELLGERPERVDWRPYFPAVQDQQGLASGSAFACVALLRYFERRASGRAIEPSPMFVYKTAQRLLNRAGDGGVPLRTTLKAIVRLGAPSERHCPYDPARVDEQPDAFAYGAARDFGSLRYVRLDARGQVSEDVLRQVKTFLAAGFPCVFGFTVCACLSARSSIPYPTIFDDVCGGQAAVAVGYDDNRRVRSEKGALMIRLSWGAGWGKRGYGWLPYRYVREQMAADFWTLLKPDWLASGEFERPA